MSGSIVARVVTAARRISRKHATILVIVVTAMILLVGSLWLSAIPPAGSQCLKPESPNRQCPSTDDLPYSSKFIIVTSERSGSGWLSKLLNNHTNIVCGHELVRQETKLHTTSERSSPQLYADTTDQKINLLYKDYQERNRRRPTHEKLQVGFKVM